jgi:hypothetical protein
MQSRTRVLNKTKTEGEATRTTCTLFHSVLSIFQVHYTMPKQLNESSPLSLVQLFVVGDIHDISQPADCLNYFSRVYNSE